MKDFPEEYEKEKTDQMYRELNISEEILELLKKYFESFSEFYHRISLRDVFDIIKRQNGDIISVEDFIAFTEIIRHEKLLHYLVVGREELYDDVPDSEPMDRELVEESLIEFEEVYEGVKAAQSGKPLYVPPKEELLKYSDEQCYYERTPETEALKLFLTEKTGLDEEKAEDIIVQCRICITCAVLPEENPAEAVNRDFFLCRTATKFTNFQRREFMRLVCDMVNNTRLPCNRGFTPNELAKRFGLDDFKSVAAVANSEKSFTSDEIGLVEYFHPSEKVGRNDPCPCGSGKKYKKCCGRAKADG